MMNPARLDLTVWRNSRFPSDTEFGVALDLTGSRILMQLRLYDGAGGDPLLDLTSDPTSGDRIQIVSIDTVKPETVFRLHVAEATHENLPGAARAGQPVTFRHDILIGPFGLEEPLAYGTYTLMPGVTR